MSTELDELRAERERLLDRHELISWAVREIEELELSAALQRAAYQRAARLWREGHPERALTDPDLTQLCGWLLERLDAAGKL